MVEVSASSLQEASTKKEYHITHDDLPLSCPMDNMRIWDSHPKVYLPIEKTGTEICPYCGAKYILTQAVNPKE